MILHPLLRMGYRTANFRTRQLMMPAMHRGSSTERMEPYTLRAPCMPRSGDGETGTRLWKKKARYEPA